MSQTGNGPEGGARKDSGVPGPGRPDSAPPESAPPEGTPPAGAALGRITPAQAAPAATAPPPAAAAALAEAAAQDWPMGAPLRVGIVALAVLVLGFGGWAAGTSISGAVIAPGVVQVEQSRQVVQHPDGGVVAQIMVKDGDTVVAGTPLIRLDGELLRSELAIVEGQYFGFLARTARLEAERDGRDAPVFPAELLTEAQVRPALAQVIAGQRSLFVARAETLSKTLEQLERRRDQSLAQIDGIEAQLAALATQSALIEKELTDQRSLLDKGLAQASRVLSLEREAARLQGQIGELIASRAQTQGRITEIELEALRQSSSRREEAETQLRDIGFRLLELAERRAALKGKLDRLEIRAPVSGVVLSMQVTTPRAVIRPAEPVLYIVPQDRPLVIEARVSILHVDEIRPGQTVRLRFSAFSSRTTPELAGTLTRISPDALTEEASGMRYYAAEVSIAPEEVERLGGLQLVPGMPVEVYARTASRSPLAYLVKPLTDYFNRAFRES